MVLLSAPLPARSLFTEPWCTSSEVMDGPSSLLCDLVEISHDMWNPFNEKIRSVFERFVNEIDLAKIALSCHFALDVICYKDCVHDCMTLHRAPFLWSVCCSAAPLPPLRSLVVHGVNLCLASAYSQKIANRSSARILHCCKMDTKRRSTAEKHFLALLWQQIDIKVEKTLKTPSYKCHPAFQSCIPEDQSRHRLWWRIQLPGYQSLEVSKSSSKNALQLLLALISRIASAMVSLPLRMGTVQCFEFVWKYDRAFLGSGIFSFTSSPRDN